MSAKLLWNMKYIPNKFHQLLSYEKINREILIWLKAWDSVVFKKKVVEEEDDEPFATPSKEKISVKAKNFYMLTPNK